MNLQDQEFQWTRCWQVADIITTIESWSKGYLMRKLYHHRPNREPWGRFHVLCHKKEWEVVWTP